MAPTLGHGCDNPRVLNLRRAVAADAPDLHRVAEAAYTPYLERMGGLRPGPLDEDYAALVADDEVWIAEDDDGVSGFLVLAEKRLNENGGVAKVGRHSHFGDADEVRLQRVVVHVAAGEQFAQHVAHLLADAEQADGAAFGSFVAAHFNSLPSLRA